MAVAIEESPVVAAVAGGAAVDELAKLAEQVARSVVRVQGTRESHGSGVLWDRPGIVVTNHHVVPGEQATVWLAGQAVPARVVARAPAVDVAVLRLGQTELPDGLKRAAVGAARSLRVGELVLAVGNPLGQRNGVTLGMLHGWARRGEFEALRLGITLRPGNSGGALADVAGRVVGLPNMVVGYGQGMAVPSEIVERVLAGSIGSPEAPSEEITWA